jgi:purine nucleoside permease
MGRLMQALRLVSLAAPCIRAPCIRAPCIAALCLAMVLGAAAHVERAFADAAPPAAPIAVKVMIISMFKPEAAPWLEALHPDQDITVPGLPEEYPSVHCTHAGVCLMTTAMGHANAAASIMAVAYSGLFDLKKTYFIIAGIAGIDPAQGTLGSAAWARYAVDSGIAFEIDARELPPKWTDGYFGIDTDAPGQVPKFSFHTEVFQLNEALLQKALAVTKSAVLEDSEDIQEYRRHYVEQAARLAPRVIQCDTLSTDTWWVGRHLGEHARTWTRLLTNGAGNYCTSQEEDNATLGALTRAAHSGLIDFKRVALLRTGSDFDRPYEHQTTIDCLRAQRKLTGAFRTATDNLARAAMPLVEAISNDWAQWEAGVPE